MESQVLFLPIVFTCESNNDYKKIQSPITDFKEHSKLVDVIKHTFGLKFIDDESVIQPIMQLYHPEDFCERDIDLFLEFLSNEIAEETKKEHIDSLVEKPLVSIVHTSTGTYPYKEMTPIFKPLNQIPNVKDNLTDGDIRQGEVSLLFFLMPIVISHPDVEKLDEEVISILEYEFDDDDMDLLSVAMNDYFKLEKSKILVCPISHIDIIEEEFSLILETFSFGIDYINSEKNIPIVNPNKINRNDDCYCGSGKKYKKCCIHKLN